jgi:hypothetical protein
MQIAAYQLSEIVNLLTHTGVEFTRYVRRTPWEETFVILVSILLYPSSQFSFYLISPFNSAMCFPFAS